MHVADVYVEELSKVVTDEVCHKVMLTSHFTLLFLTRSLSAHGKTADKVFRTLLSFACHRLHVRFFSKLFSISEDLLIVTVYYLYTVLL